MSGVYFTVLRKYDNSGDMNKLISFYFDESRE